RFWLLSAAALDPAHPGTVYASWDAYSVGSRLYRSTDAGGSWRRIAVQGVRPSFASLAIDAGTPATILATDNSDPGVYRSTDGGATWIVVTLPPKGADGLRVFAGGHETLYATTSSGTVFTSTDAGATWRTVGTEAGLTGPLVVDPRNPETLYGSTDGVVKS